MARSWPLILACLAGCVAIGGPLPPEREPPLQRRVVQAGVAAVWDAALRTLEERSLRPSADREDGVIRATDHRRRKPGLGGEREIRKELARIADVEPARRRGLEDVSEYRLRYTIAVEDAGEEESRIEITTEIAAIDRSRAILVGPGLVHVIPQYFPLRSRGVAERELMRSIAHELFLGEESLYYMGELGRD